MVAFFTPREIVSELDRFVIGQQDAKRAVAVALRNRWRRMQVAVGLREEILPKNILMIGHTGVGKTEIARRLAKLAQVPFLKVEATKFTEVGYVGRDVEQIIRDLLEIALNMTRAQLRKEVLPKAELHAEERVLKALTGDKATPETKQRYRKMLREGTLDDREIEIKVQDSTGFNMPTFDIPGMPGSQMGMLNLNEMLSKTFGANPKLRRLTVAQSYPVLIAEESDKLLDQERVRSDALQLAEQHGIVFIDEIDKICTNTTVRGHGEVSREGVQRDLLPLLEGTSVSTKHGTVMTDHILFIASGAFHQAKPSDLLPELQGRLPIRVGLQPLTESDFLRILTEPEGSLIKQYQALMATEQVQLLFQPDAIAEIAKLAVEINMAVENIGARRLHTVMERLLEKISFEATDLGGQSITIEVAYVRERVADLSRDTDLSKFIL